MLRDDVTRVWEEVSSKMHVHKFCVSEIDFLEQAVSGDGCHYTH